MASHRGARSCVVYFNLILSPVRVQGQRDQKEESDAGGIGGRAESHSSKEEGNCCVLELVTHRLAARHYVSAVIATTIGSFSLLFLSFF